VPSIDTLTCPNTFDRVNEAVKLLLEKGNRVGINIVISRDNFDDFLDFISYIKRYNEFENFVELNVLLFKPFGRGTELLENFLDYQQRTRLLLMLNELGSNWDRLKFNEFCTPMVMRPSYPPELKDFFSRSGCGAGFITLNMGVDGKVTPCSYSQHIERSFGNMTKTSLRKIWESELFLEFRKYNRKNPCVSCTNEFCGGVCKYIPEKLASVFLDVCNNGYGR
jgi:radical SAM protein with 4Fe4S-binding SPASM domain